MTTLEKKLVGKIQRQRTAMNQLKALYEAKLALAKRKQTEAEAIARIERGKYIALADKRLKFTKSMEIALNALSQIKFEDLAGEDKDNV